MPGIEGQQPQPQAPGDSQPQSGDNEYDKLFDPNYDGSGSLEDAAREVPGPKKSDVQIKTEQQMGISAADRKLREEKGLPPPTADLR